MTAKRLSSSQHQAFKVPAPLEYVRPEEKDYKPVIPYQRKTNSQDKNLAPLIPIDSDSEFRCSDPNCNKLFAKGDLGRGSTIEIKCPRCKTMCRFMKI
jgi:hypothetical protein